MNILLWLIGNWRVAGVSLLAVVAVAYIGYSEITLAHRASAIEALEAEKRYLVFQKESAERNVDALGQAMRHQSQNTQTVRVIERQIRDTNETCTDLAPLDALFDGLRDATRPNAGSPR